MTRYNVQIHIQRVDEIKPEPSRGALGLQGKTEREVVEVLKLAVTASTEQEAYLKAHRMLTANESIGE